MSIFDMKPKTPSNDPHDWVYEATYEDNGKNEVFKFNPLKGVDPVESARNIIFQQFRDRNGAISDDRYTVYLCAQASLKVKRHHEII